VIMSGVGCDAVNPGRKGGFTAESAKRPADLRENGLSQILSVGFAGEAAEITKYFGLEVLIYACEIFQTGSPTRP